MQRIVLCTIAIFLLALNACKDPVSTIDPKNVQSSSDIVVFDSTAARFGDVPVGTTRNFVAFFRDMDLSNGANITAVTFTGADAAMFTITYPPTFPIHLSPNAGYGMSISFKPTRVGYAGAVLTLTVSTAAGVAAVRDSLIGNGYSGSLCFNVPRLDFGMVYHSSRPGLDSPAVMEVSQLVTVTNCSVYTVDISNKRGTYALTSAVDDDSTHNVDLVSGSTTMAPGASVTLRAWMRPKLIGPNQGTLTISSPQLQTPATLPLSVTGDTRGFPATNWDTVFVALAGGAAPTRFGTWIYNTRPFPITLNHTSGNQDQNYEIKSDVDYTASPVVINAGDSLLVPFTLTWLLQSPITLNTMLLYGFTETSYISKPLKVVL